MSRSRSSRSHSVTRVVSVLTRSSWGLDCLNRDGWETCPGLTYLEDGDVAVELVEVAEMNLAHIATVLYLAHKATVLYLA